MSYLVFAAGFMGMYVLLLPMIPMLFNRERPILSFLIAGLIAAVLLSLIYGMASVIGGAL